MSPKPPSMQSTPAAMAPLGQCSRAWVAKGTGGRHVTNAIDAWNRRYSDRHTSRSVFKAFCESIEMVSRGGTTRCLGDAPQAGVLRILTAHNVSYVN